MNYRFKLGQKARDIVTGIEGIIVGRSEWITGCTTYGIVPKAEDGKRKDAEWFDEMRLELIDSESIFDKRKEQPDRTTGGLQPVPKQYSM